MSVSLVITGRIKTALSIIVSINASLGGVFSGVK